MILFRISFWLNLITCALSLYLAVLQIQTKQFEPIMIAVIFYIIVATGLSYDILRKEKSGLD